MRWSASISRAQIDHINSNMQYQIMREVAGRVNGMDSEGPIMFKSHLITQYFDFVLFDRGKLYNLGVKTSRWYKNRTGKTKTNQSYCKQFNPNSLTNLKIFFVVIRRRQTHLNVIKIRYTTIIWRTRLTAQKIKKKWLTTPTYVVKSDILISSDWLCLSNF